MVINDSSIKSSINIWKFSQYIGNWWIIEFVFFSNNNHRWLLLFIFLLAARYSVQFKHLSCLNFDSAKNPVQSIIRSIRKNIYVSNDQRRLEFFFRNSVWGKFCIAILTIQNHWEMNEMDNRSLNFSFFFFSINSFVVLISFEICPNFK